MKCQDIINILERQSPTEYAMDWDNVGLLLGRRNRDIHRILLAVDATSDVCRLAIDNNVDMIITHHPVIFSGLKKINDDTVLGAKLLTLAEAGICCYAMHTNFDTKGGMAKEAAKMLSLKNPEVLEETLGGEGIGEIGLLDKGVTLIELAEHVKKVFDLDSVSVYGDMGRFIEKIAVVPGSGKSDINIAVMKGAECLITGDIGHHEGIDAVDMGLTIIDASHYGIEKLFMNYMYNYLKDYLDDVEILIADVGVPFKVV